MRILPIFALIFAGFAAALAPLYGWPGAAYAPGSLVSWQPRAPVSLPITEGGLRALEAEHGLPPGLLSQLWLEESSRQQMAPTHPRSGAVGPFQVKPDTAGDFGCSSGWREGMAAADCAARILAGYVKGCGGRVVAGLVRYGGWGGCWDKPTAKPLRMFRNALKEKMV